MTLLSPIHKRIRAVVYVLSVPTAACDACAGKTVYAGGPLWTVPGAPPILDAVIIVPAGHMEGAAPRLTEATPGGFTIALALVLSSLA